MLFIGTYAEGELGGACCTTGAVVAGSITEGSPKSIGIIPEKPIPRIKATAVIPIAIEMPNLSTPRFFVWEVVCGLDALGLSNPFGKAPLAIVA
jgi:hypothetical protein